MTKKQNKRYKVRALRRALNRTRDAIRGFSARRFYHTKHGRQLDMGALLIIIMTALALSACATLPPDGIFSVLVGIILGAMAVARACEGR